MIDLTTELTAWLRSTDARTLMKEIVAELELDKRILKEALQGNY